MGRDRLQESRVGFGPRLLLYGEGRDEHRRGGAGVPGVRTESQPGLGPAPVHPGIHLSLYRTVRAAEAARVAVRGGEESGGGASMSRGDVNIVRAKRN